MLFLVSTLIFQLLSSTRFFTRTSLLHTHALHTHALLAPRARTPRTLFLFLVLGSRQRSASWFSTTLFFLVLDHALLLGSWFSTTLCFLVLDHTRLGSRPRTSSLHTTPYECPSTHTILLHTHVHIHPATCMCPIPWICTHLGICFPNTPASPLIPSHPHNLPGMCTSKNQHIYQAYVHMRIPEREYISTPTHSFTPAQFTKHVYQ